MTWNFLWRKLLTEDKKVEKVKKLILVLDTKELWVRAKIIFIIFIKKLILVPFFTTIGVMAPLKNYPILSGSLIWLFRHLEIKICHLCMILYTQTWWWNKKLEVGVGIAAAIAAGKHFYRIRFEAEGIPITPK